MAEADELRAVTSRGDWAVSPGAHPDLELLHGASLDRNPVLEGSGMDAHGRERNNEKRPEVTASSLDLASLERHRFDSLEHHHLVQDTA